MPKPQFQYGLYATIHPDQQDEFNACKENLVADTRPGNFLEQLLVDELLHAQWELRRAEHDSANPENEAACIAATARATRNWQRATRELTALQTARASAMSLTNDEEIVDAPCADLTKIPARKPAGRAIRDWHFEHMALTRATAGQRN